MALTLRLLGGLPVAEIAAAFPMTETTMAQRLSRAKKKIDRLPRAIVGGYHPLHVARAEMLRRPGRNDDARACCDEALALFDNPAEAAYLMHRRGQSD